jgi:hypothetical protein
MVRSSKNNRSHIFILLSTTACLMSCSESKIETSASAKAQKVDCAAVDNEALELSRKADTRAKAAARLDESIAKCPADAGRHRNRAILAVYLGDPRSEKENIQAAVRIAERSGDRCLIDLMRIEARALERRAPSREELPQSCKAEAGERKVGTLGFGYPTK